MGLRGGRGGIESAVQLGIATISHDSGDSIRTTELHVRGNGFADEESSGGDVDVANDDDWDMDSDISPKTWEASNAEVSGSVGSNSAVTGGDKLNIVAQSDFDFSLVWEPEEGDTSATLTQETGPDA